MKIDFGIIGVTLEGLELYQKLATPGLWDQKVNEINANIGKEVAITIDAIYPAKSGQATTYTVQTGEQSVIISRGAQRNDQWWFTPVGEEADPIKAFLVKAASDVRIAVGDKLKVMTNSSLIPLQSMAKELWWFTDKPSASHNITPELHMQKIIDGIVSKQYSTLIGKIVGDR